MGVEPPEKHRLAILTAKEIGLREDELGEVTALGNAPAAQRGNAPGAQTYHQYIQARTEDKEHRLEAAEEDDWKEEVSWAAEPT